MVDKFSCQNQVKVQDVGSSCSASEIIIIIIRDLF